ncbi:MAG: class I SAM-dependent methyltransferase [Parcubacteria group bacterium]|nr:class I SAM-dependent methyltransferase [Parcubacteria group bacterium]
MKFITEVSDKESTADLIEHNYELLNSEGVDIDWKKFINKKLESFNCKSMLDIGCHDCSITKLFNVPHRVGIDLFAEIGPIASKYCDFKQMDMRDILSLGEDSFDATIQLDSIEHLNTVEECDKLVEDMEKVAKHISIHMVPTDSLMSQNLSSDAYREMPFFIEGRTNMLQQHNIQLSKEYFVSKGYEVKVIAGDLKNILAWKALNKGEKNVKIS